MLPCCFLREISVCFRKSKTCWQWEVYQAKNWMKITSRWIPTRRRDNIPAVLRNQFRKPITCQWPQGPSISLRLECRFLLLLTWASGPARRPLPEGQFLSQTVNRPRWIGTSSRTEKVRRAQPSKRVRGASLRLHLTVMKCKMELGLDILNYFTSACLSGIAIYRLVIVPHVAAQVRFLRLLSPEQRLPPKIRGLAGSRRELAETTVPCPVSKQNN